MFYEVWTTRFLLNSNFVLLFNKQDILREKIERGHKIEDHFPEYKLYKCQPQDRALLTRAGEKLNLFRSSSSWSARSTGSRSGSTSGPSSGDPSGSLREKRKSSLYRRFPGQSKKESSSATCKDDSSSTQDPTNSNSNANPMRGASTSTGGSDRNLDCQTNSNNETNSQASNENNHNHNIKHQDNNQPQHNKPQATSKMTQQQNEMAYIRARSFIRDKFLQITRQVDHPNDARKFSTPNFMYSAKGVDQPKRNVCYHYTTATDTENIRNLFESLQKMVIKSTMKDLS